MKLGNGMGGISKAPGNRRRPYCARITTGWVFDEEKQKKKQVQKVIGYYRTKKEALEALVMFNRDPYDLDALAVTFGECYEAIPNAFPESMARQYRNAYKHLLPIADKPIRSIKAGQLQECIDSCAASQQTLAKTICKRVYDYAIMNEYIDKNPVQFIKATPIKTQIEREMFTADEIKELWKLKDAWWASVTLILLYSGMRTKELKDLTADDVDLENGMITITQAKNECSKRTIPIHKRILPLISAYMTAGGNLYNYGHGNLNRLLREFHGHRAHDCRHTFTTRIRECGVDHVTVQRLVGHTPSDITYAVYTHISDKELKDAIGKLKY